MTTEKYFALRHPEFRKRADSKIREKDETDYEEVIAVVPYKEDKFPHEEDYNRRVPAEADESIKYDHSITHHLFGERVPDIVLDIVEISVITFAADKAADRGIQIDNEDLDESRLNTRNIKLQIPVLSPKMATEEMEQLYSEMVSHMTRDIIEYDFQLVDKQESVEVSTNQSEFDAVCLLSDGLDSTAGIYHNLRRETDSEHVTVNYGSGAGSKAKEIADQADVSSRIFRTQYNDKGESTQFSRGLLHLSFAAVAASAHGTEEIRCFENGIMAQFLILSEGWMTTRTVSPLFLTYFNKILDNALPQPIEVKNPFVNLTKTEIINKIPSTELVQKTLSCPHKSWFGHNNCGLCMPCLIRNIGIIRSDHEIPLEVLSRYDPLLSADFEYQSFEVDGNENLNNSANTPSIFFKGITEIAYFCRRILEDDPRDLATEHPELLNKPIYEQHRQFAENFTEALELISEQNSTIQTLLTGQQHKLPQ
ncbi:7-cyano-7-deazaguanine synthase [Natrinema sp. DC36]|uniref:7-cyano-7-deazaguanine synthase n=1 Tax=Natrinema sp. DC36 TaxID=2878680 RepID=UPI001CF060AA|nr:7-cyano-7-deazaguanine synthase [Natrinema sp. DC36]